MTQTSLQQWFAGMPTPRFERPGRGAAGAFDIKHRGRDEDVPELKEARAPLPRGNLPSHVTPGETETGEDDDVDLGELVEQLYRECHARGLPTRDIEHAVEPLLAQTEGGGDAGPTPQHLVDDQSEPLDDEVIERVMRHAKAKLSPSAAEGLEDMLRSAPGADDDLPEALRGTKEGERLREYLDGKDRHSISDRLEAADAVGHALELMKERGQFDAGTGPRMAERRGTEPWHPGKGEPPGADLPRPGGVVRPPGSLVPSEHHQRMGTDSRMPRMKVRPFHKVIGVRKRDLPRVLG
jgi:hypothetical protein